MRLTSAQINAIKSTAYAVLNESVPITLFGSRVYDDKRGGDVDLMVELSWPIEDPAVLAARLAGRISHALLGRKVDILLKAPNLLEQPIHRIANREGIRL